MRQLLVNVPDTMHRILVYGLQSSGASLTAFLLGQKNNSLVIPDILHKNLAPKLKSVCKKTERIVVKCTVTSVHSLDEHERKFQPDKTILLVRDPGINYVSLDRKAHRDMGGSIEEKFRLQETYFQNRDRFDAVVRYEDLIFRPSRFIETLARAEIEVKRADFEIPRTRLSILRTNAERSPWCRRNYRMAWGLGQVKADAIESKYALKHVPDVVDEKVKSLCPSLKSLYKKYELPAAYKISYLIKKSIWRGKIRPYLSGIYKYLKSYEK